MAKNSIERLGDFGQSIWLDYIARSLIQGGTLKRLIAAGLRGLTSNPTIFDKAIGKSTDYDSAIQQMSREGKSTLEIYDELTVKDIQDAADIFREVYENTGQSDGYVSLEVNPKLAFDVDETIEEAIRLHKKVNRPNVMFKIPSTEHGFRAVEELTARGVNVNVTLIFSLEQYRKTFNAYTDGITRYIEDGGDAAKVRSVASVFVSRIDTVCDRLIDEKIAAAKEPKVQQDLLSLKGKAAVANSAVIYSEFRRLIATDAFSRLREKGARIQKVLWGSTSTKNPEYSDIKYVTELIGVDTVNTIPQNTFDAFLDHGYVKEALTADTQNHRSIIEQLRDIGIDVDKICAQLLEDGVAAFEKSFDSLLESIEKKAAQLCER